MTDQKRGLEPPEITTTVSPLAATYCDRFNVSLMGRSILLTLCSPAPIGSQGAFASIPAFVGALSHADAQALAKALQEALLASTTLAAKEDNPQ